MSVSPRKVIQIIKPQMVIEGAGVLLRRSFSPSRENPFDPFLLSTILDSTILLRDPQLVSLPIHIEVLKRLHICLKGMCDIGTALVIWALSDRAMSNG